MSIDVLVLLIFLQIKHWYVDFVNQSMEEVASKGIYGDRAGINHSAKHALATFCCIAVVAGPAYITIAIALALFDLLTHYHIDWVKMNYGNRDIQNPTFWNHLGLDQMAHQLVYLLIAAMMP